MYSNCVVKVIFENFNPEEKNLRASGIVSIKVEGHAGFGSKGSDIICAGISAIIQTGTLGITGVASLEQKIIQRHGYLESKIYASEADSKGREALYIILKTISLGLLEIASNYPGSLEIVFL